MLRSGKTDPVAQLHELRRIRGGIRAGGAIESTFSWYQADAGRADLRIRHGAGRFTLNAIPRRSVAHDVASHNSAAVIPEFIVGLRGRLRRQEIGSATIRTAATRQATARD